MSTTRYDAMRLDYVVWHRLCRFYFEIYVLLSCIDDLSISVFYTNTIIILLHAYIYIYNENEAKDKGYHILEYSSCDKN